MSIVIPAYNAAQWIAETLASVDRERWEEVETIVIDDGATDSTATIVARDYPWVRLERQSNQGCSAARRRGTELAKGRYIKYLDADDLLVPGVLRRQLAMAVSTNADVVYGNWRELIKTSVGIWEQGDRVERSIHDVNTDVELAFFTHMWCTTAAYLWSAEFLKTKHPGWHSALPIIQDARFALDAAMAGAVFVHDNAISALYRKALSDSVSTRSRSDFAADCFLNLKEIHHLWREKGQLTAPRRKAVLDLCEHFGFTIFGIAPDLGEQIFAFGAEVDAEWKPGLSLKRRACVRLMGLHNAARLHGLVGEWRRKLNERFAR